MMMSGTIRHRKRSPSPLPRQEIVNNKEAYSVGLKVRRWKPPTGSLLNFSKRQIRRAVFLIVLVLGIPLQRALFGNKTIHGGLLGRLVDNTIRTYTFRQAIQQRNDMLAELGFHLPPLTQQNVNKRGIPVMTQIYLTEMILRSSQRRTLQQKIMKVKEPHDKCEGIPKWILQPNSQHWYRPLVEQKVDIIMKSKRHQVVEFEESEMRKFMTNHFPLLPQDNVPIWGLCAVYWYGGSFVGSSVKDLENIDEIWTDQSRGDGCNDQAIAIFHGSVIHRIQATPRHPMLACAIRNLEKMDHAIRVVDYSSLFVENAASDSRTLATAKDGAWFENSCLNLEEGADGCCGIKETMSLNKPSLYLQTVDTKQQKQKHYPVENNQFPVPQSVLKTVENSSVARQKKRPKESIGKILADAHCEAGWLCNRCLKTSWYGTFAACSAVCRSCYVDTMCHHPINFLKPTRVYMDVVVKQRRKLLGEKRIPRIIHQTWFEEITSDRYPHLLRLQQSWKSSGWEFRFYSDKTARDYIQNHFPSQVLEGFDALRPGAFKADFFRLLVLLRDGGIYADADVKLNVDLDAFITPNLGLFVPRDTIAGYAAGEYCLWNGLLGAEAGHPFIAKAVDRILNVVLSRADYYDIEREVCRRNHDSSGSKTEVWKLRALDILTLTGPCALGMSVNEALGNNDLLSRFDTGWLRVHQTNPEVDNVGDILILVSDKYDMGEMRFTDVDRNLLIASTEHTMLAKTPLSITDSDLDHSDHPIAKSHYSSSEYISDIFGAEGVYSDSLIRNEIYTVRLTNQ